VEGRAKGEQMKKSKRKYIIRTRKSYRILRDMLPRIENLTREQMIEKVREIIDKNDGNIPASVDTIIADYGLNKEVKICN